MEGTKRRHQHARVREATQAEHSPAGRPDALNGVLLDSDVVIEILRGNRSVAEALASLESAGVPTYCTAIAWTEIHAGLRRGEETVTEDFFRARGEVVLDARAGRLAGAYLARYRRSHALEIADALVAAAASSAGLRLWTLNRRHYPMRDLRFFDSAAGQVS